MDGDTTRTDVFGLLEAGDLVALKAALEAERGLAASSNGDGASLLSAAAYRGNKDAAALIRGYLPTVSPYEACILGEPDALRAAIADGWDANRPAPDGFGALALACFFGQRAIAEMLIPLTADIDFRARNMQQVAALHAAAARRDAALVEMLLRAGADPNLPQQQGFRPLHTAAQHDDAVLAGLLILCGADPALAATDGRTPADLARERGHEWLAARLSPRGR